MRNFSFRDLDSEKKSFILDALWTQEEGLSDDEIESLASEKFDMLCNELLLKNHYRIYRCIYVSESKALEIENGSNAGLHWSLRKNVAENWIASQCHEDNLKIKLILEASVTLEDIDIPATVSNNIACPHEFEITIKDDAKICSSIVENIAQ